MNKKLMSAGLLVMFLWLVSVIANPREFLKKATAEYKKCRDEAFEKFTMHGIQKRYFADLEKCRMAFEKAREIYKDEIGGKKKSSI